MILTTLKTANRVLVWVLCIIVVYLTIIWLCGCAASARVDSVVRVLDSLSAEVVGIKTVVEQTAGGDINDTWSVRLLIFGCVATLVLSVVASNFVYIKILRVMRLRKNGAECPTPTDPT